MKFNILTLFPEMVVEGLNSSIIARAKDKGLIDINAVNIRDYTEDKHKKVDDYPYGGGAGMLIQAQPVYSAYRSVVDENELDTTRVIYVTPQGKLFDQEAAQGLAKEEKLVILCGHYEGVDERVLEEIVTDYYSIGDYVLTGGELQAMVMIDAISRLVPGVLNNKESSIGESHTDGLLEHPQYTRPEEWMGRSVPQVLLSGHHKNIEKWKLEESLERTKLRRSDMYDAYMSNKNNS